MPDLRASSSGQPRPDTPFHQLSFFPTENPVYLPKDLYQIFNLPRDEPHYNTQNLDELLNTTSLHLGQTLGGFSRILALQKKNKEEAEGRLKLEVELDQLKQDHSFLHDQHIKLLEDQIKTQTELHESLVQAQVDRTVLKELQTQLAEADHRNQTLEARLADVTIERTTLLEERTERTQRSEQLSKENEELKQLRSQLTKDMVQKDAGLNASYETIRQLLEDIKVLKAEAERPSEATCQAIIEEYKQSDELTEAVMDQFSRGYQFAKEKITKAGTNPILLGFSSDEDVSDAEEEMIQKAANNPPDEEAAGSDKAEPEVDTSKPDQNVPVQQTPEADPPPTTSNI